ncbi:MULTISPECIES: YeeE/YedE family protein [Hyphomicrobiales]|uniref:YeeE/YedE family protein n=1 Tax=Hyphomicrobiales TaxID=356 RepID=UPI000F660A2A|nr:MULTISPECIES: YeeE/YedE family protein [Hyphomicrobiales]MDH0367215.1 YeeE/YedE family protein [Brucella anthropi]MDH1269737.1 YeeE/YedE family protein [Agrobacterium pusense]RRY17934.1 YeeE/YedE family protein [Brucella anthropi]UYT56188.1 YeeE/YedE family protein [Brucella sp. MAB-22]
MTAAMRILTSLAAGLLFGLGLAISGLLNPAKVKAFLDITGAWDPSLIFVLGAGVVVAFIGYRIAFAINKPLFDDKLQLPTKTRIDRPLIIGSSIFGVGWGLAGFCPGPAIASLSLGLLPAVIFAVAMFIGMVTHDRFLAGKV